MEGDGLTMKCSKAALKLTESSKNTFKRLGKKALNFLCFPFVLHSAKIRYLKNYLHFDKPKKYEANSNLFCTTNA